MAPEHSSQSTTLLSCPQADGEPDLLSQECIDCLKYEPTHQAEGKLCEQARFEKLKMIVFCVWPFLTITSYYIKSVPLNPQRRTVPTGRTDGQRESKNGSLTLSRSQRIKMMLNTGIKNYRTL